jgi:hypothetical protein
MAKKKGGRMVPATDSDVRHIQIQLPAEPYDRGKEIAKANGLSMAAYVRQTLLQRMRDDSERIDHRSC